MYDRYNRCGLWQQGFSRWPSRVPVDIMETEEAYIIQLYAPALKKENFVITTREDILSVSYRDEAEARNSAFIRREYRPAVDRTFDLKGKVIIGSINARYEDGVLKLVLPKTDAARRPQTPVAVQ